MVQIMAWWHQATYYCCTWISDAHYLWHRVILLSHKELTHWLWGDVAECAYLKEKLGIDSLNTLRPRQDGRHFAGDTFKCIFLNENVRISIKISLKFVAKGPINNIQALLQIMAWRRPGDKPLSEPMLVFIPTHICVTRPQWVKYPNKYYPGMHVKVPCWW